MWTFQYKPGWYISGYFDRSECTYAKASDDGFGIYELHNARTLLGAMRAITRANKAEK